MAKIAHTQNDVKKRRATFEERWKAFQGNMYNEEQIRKEVFAPIWSHMAGLSGESLGQESGRRAVSRHLD